MSYKASQCDPLFQKCHNPVIQNTGLVHRDVTSPWLPPFNFSSLNGIFMLIEDVHITTSLFYPHNIDYRQEKISWCILIQSPIGYTENIMTFKPKHTNTHTYTHTQTGVYVNAMSHRSYRGARSVVLMSWFSCALQALLNMVNGSAGSEQGARREASSTWPSIPHTKSYYILPGETEHNVLQGETEHNAIPGETEHNAIPGET